MQVKKLSVATVYGKIAARDVPAGGKDMLVIMEVAGTAAALKFGESSFGPWTALVGDFAARKAGKDEDGNPHEWQRSSKVFLPDVALEPLLPYVGNGQQVEFAIRVGVIENTKVATGYEYVVEPLSKTGTEDRLVPLLGLFDAQDSNVSKISDKQAIKSGKK